MTAALVRLASVAKTYANGVAALADLTLDVPQGGFLALLGPSGCGKSTGLRLLAGLSEPDRGVRDWPGGRPATGFVFQDPTLLPWASAAANVALPLRLLGRPAAARQEAARAALARVGLAGFDAALPRELSGGMRMRVSLARALVTAPQLLLLDEPFAALDELTREDLNDSLLELWGAARFAAVFVTHSVREAVFLAEEILVMSPRPGRIIARFRNPDPVPRPDGYRMQPGYLALCAAVSAALRGGIAAAT